MIETVTTRAASRHRGNWTRHTEGAALLWSPENYGNYSGSLASRTAELQILVDTRVK